MVSVWAFAAAAGMGANCRAGSGPLNEMGSNQWQSSTRIFAKTVWKPGAVILPLVRECCGSSMLAMMTLGGRFSGLPSFVICVGGNCGGGVPFHWTVMDHDVAVGS